MNDERKPTTEGSEEFEKELADTRWEVNPAWTTPEDDGRRTASIELIQDKKFRRASIFFKGDTGALHVSTNEVKFEEAPEFNSNKINEEFEKLINKFLEGEL